MAKTPVGGRNAHFCVRNLNGTSKNQCECRSWLRHWKNYTGSGRTLCAVVPCGREAEVGGHVQIDDWRSDFSWWIVPLCKQHNHYRNTREMYLDKRTELVSANVARTCSRDGWDW